MGTIERTQWQHHRLIARCCCVELSAHVREQFSLLFDVVGKLDKKNDKLSKHLGVEEVIVLDVKGPATRTCSRHGGNYLETDPDATHVVDHKDVAVAARLS